MPKRRKVRNTRKYVLRVERALAGGKISPERLANFERHMSAREKLGRNSDVAYALKALAQMHMITDRSVIELERFEKAQRAPGQRTQLKRKLGLSG